MIRKSFIFLDKISFKTEQNIWQQDINDWDIFLKTKKIKGISSLRKHYYDRQIQEAKKQLFKENSTYFTTLLPKKETWRLYQYFKEETCFLDVEVDSQGKIILLGIADNDQTKILIKNVNLEPETTQTELNKYKLIITFNGSSFDLPKLKKQLKLNRPQNLKGSPVGLWKTFHASGDQEWLDLLIDYNKEDIENLQAITNYCYRELIKKIYK
tara:strand:- start:130 stop:765 length:636 start_codon:yes stop_codon:yes gene_type:complete